METKLIEAGQRVKGSGNWGKFAVSRFTAQEWRQRSAMDPLARSLVRSCGWSPEHVWVMDVQTGEGAFFRHGGSAGADLNGNHQIWVCPMFEPFLVWLYKQDISDLSALPDLVELPDAPFSFGGYRRRGAPWRRYDAFDDAGKPSDSQTLWLYDGEVALGYYDGEHFRLASGEEFKPTWWALVAVPTGPMG